MSELQNDSLEPEVIENQEIETDLAPVSEAEHEEQPHVDEEAVKQEAINKAINKKHFEAQQAKRDLDAANNRIANFEAKEREQMAAQMGNIPDMPDPFDDDFDVKVKQRDEALIANTNYNTQNQAYLNNQAHQQQQQAQAKQAEVQKAIASYTGRATELGIKQPELNAAANIVSQYGLSDDLVFHILADKDGPLITKYLADHSDDGIELATMSPYLVGQYLDGIKTKAGALKPKTSSTPSPATNLSGNGVDPELGKYKYLEGATFE